MNKLFINYKMYCGKSLQAIRRNTTIARINIYLFLINNNCVIRKLIMPLKYLAR